MSRRSRAEDSNREVNFPETRRLMQQAFEASGCRKRSEFFALFDGAVATRTLYDWQSGSRAASPLVELMLQEFIGGWRPGMFSKSAEPKTPTRARGTPVIFRYRGREHSAPNARAALLQVMRLIVAENVMLLPKLSHALQIRSRSPIGTSPEQINPRRPDLADAEKLTDGWLIGLLMSNANKMRVIRIAAETYGLKMPRDLDISLPNA